MAANTQTAEERLRRRRERLAEEQAKIEAADKKLTAKAVIRKEQENFLRQARIDRDLYAADAAASEAKAKSDREKLSEANAYVRRLEFALGLRKRGQAPVEQPPAETTPAPQDATSGNEEGDRE